MNSARKHFEVSSKLTIANLINLFNPNKNLLTGAKDFSGDWTIYASYHEDGTYKGMKVYKTTAAWSGIYQPYTCKAGKTYTFSFYAREENNTDNLNATAYIQKPGEATNPFSSITSNNFMLQPEWKRYSVTFTMNQDWELAPRIESNAEGVPSWRCGYKLEEGSLATPLTELGGGVTKRLLFSLVPRIGGARYAA